MLKIHHPLSLLFISFVCLAYLASCNAGLSNPIFSPTQMKAPFIEQFTDDWQTRWKTSQATKIIVSDDEKQPEKREFQFNGNWSVEEPTVYPGLTLDYGLVLKSPATHHAISALFPNPIDPKGKTLVVQYEVKLQNSLECGGAYLKLVTKQSEPFVPRLFDDKTPYTIMFGPDKCGFTNKVHFIFRHKNPKTGAYEEKHLTEAPAAVISKLSTLYTLIVRPNNDFEILVNQEKVSSGNLLESFTPSVNPDKEIEDVNDKKPTDWIDEAKIPDPTAVKPADWNEEAPMYIEDKAAVRPADWLESQPLLINDPASVKPENWNDEDDGEWVPSKISNPICASVSGCGPWKRPMIENPEYKGKWTAPLIDNPAYKGPWVRRKIANPNYFEDLKPANFEPMVAIGFELWTIQSDILFDNIFIGHSEEDAKDFATRTWAVKYTIEKTHEEAADEKAKAEETSSEQAASGISAFFNELMTRLLIAFEEVKEDPVVGLQNNLPLLASVFGGLLTLVIALKMTLFSSRRPAAPTARSTTPLKTGANATAETKSKKSTSATESPSSTQDESSEPKTPTKVSKRTSVNKD